MPSTISRSLGRFFGTGPKHLEPGVADGYVERGRILGGDHDGRSALVPRRDPCEPHSAAVTPDLVHVSNVSVRRECVADELVNLLVHLRSIGGHRRRVTLVPSCPRQSPRRSWHYRSLSG